MEKKSIIKTIIITSLLIFSLIPIYSHDFNLKKKNIILFISDGCGYNHIDATNLYSYGKTGVQEYENFPVKVAMSTYNYYGSYDPNLAWLSFNYVKQGATDSAAAATAMATGIKTCSGALGVDFNGNPLANCIELAEIKGMATGVVTSVPLSHATPAGFVAHNINRFDYLGIAKEMISTSAVDVIMGCGNPWYNSDGLSIDNPQTYNYVGGEEIWEALLNCNIGADADGDGIEDPWVLIQSRKDFQALGTGNTPNRVIGIPQIFQTLQYYRSGDSYAAPYTIPFIQTVPTLKEMTKAALNILDNDPDGFFLVVEGGAVDFAGHSNCTGRMIEEQIDFNNAVNTACEWVNENSNWYRTLVIVTSDHETGYLTGPGSGETDDNGPVWNDIISCGPGLLPDLEWHSTSHTNSLVPLYAKGHRAIVLKWIARKKTDNKRGPYIDNTDLGHFLNSILKKKGDVNNDGNINIIDALIIARYYVGLNPAGFIKPIETGDTNCNGSVNILDALIIAQYYVGLVSELFP